MSLGTREKLKRRKSHTILALAEFEVGKATSRETGSIPNIRLQLEGTGRES